MGFRFFDKKIPEIKRLSLKTQEDLIRNTDQIMQRWLLINTAWTGKLTNAQITSDDQGFKDVNSASTSRAAGL